MSRPPDRPNSTGFWKVVTLLLGTARKRALGRQKRQQELLSRRTKKPEGLGRGLGIAGAFFLTLFLHGGAAYVFYNAVTAGQRLEVEHTGKIVVDRWFKSQVDAMFFTTIPGGSTTHTDDLLDRAYALTLHAKVERSATTRADDLLENAYRTEAGQIAREYGGSATAIEDRLRAAVGTNGPRDLVTRAEAAPGVSALAGIHSLPAMLGSVVLIWWAVIVIFQGEGLELDLQRRRHPMWEWLFSHPVSAVSVFTAEILSPIAANPIYWTAPLFVGILYGFTYDPALGMLAALLAGVPVSFAGACLGKALEIGTVIRFSPRSRGALLGLMGWLGYASMMLLLLSAASISKVAGVVGQFLTPLAVLPWPWLGLFLGRQSDGSFSFLAGMIFCWVTAGVTSALAVRFCVWGANQGLSGNYGGGEISRPVRSARGTSFGKEPLYRKEFLWFARDRSAIVQTILIPLTLAGLQLFNFRGLVQHAQGSWNYLCGAAILFGTYFLWVLGPKSLASEGSALWLALTWPRGLENLLKAKAWLWAMVSAGIVMLVLAYAVFLFPNEAWKVILVGIGWLVFGRSMAEKTVTLVTVTSDSGEAQPIPRGRRWAVQLGMFTFAIGVLTQRWNLVVVGIVYSQITAAAMWENFRARLPFLYDPWSEKLPPPPTLMHAMIAISVLVEGGAVITIPVIIFAGGGNIAVALSVGYTLCALIVSLVTINFLRARDVRLADVLRWGQGATSARRAKSRWCGDGGYRSNFFLALLIGAAGGVALGCLARGYMLALLYFPSMAEVIHHAQDQTKTIPGLKESYAFCAIAVAPFAEEYLFRGLLFRALDREWGGWRAVVGSAAFFAIYHPPLAWLPVGLLGVANAVLFKQTGRLAPAIILHMIYNTVVLL